MLLFMKTSQPMVSVMYEGGDKSSNFYVAHMDQTNGLIKYISNNMHGRVMQSEKKLLTNSITTR